MCGIFGYIGKKNTAAHVVLDGLKLLEYRGYDSWGVAIKEGKKLLVEKHVGKIGDATVSLPESTLGIGHTRWATHGGVTQANAHPHLDCKKEIALVHNGIVENYLELKASLLQKGHTFLSETDTEVIVHLIEEYLKKEGFASAVRDAFNMLHGLNAIVVANAASTEIIAAKTGSPLVVGIGDGEIFVASDAVGILKYTKKVIFLEDNQMVILGKGIQLTQLPNGNKIEPKIEVLTWEFEEAQKGEYAHFFLKEANEQPMLLENIALNAGDEASKLAKLIEGAFGTFMVACGSASYAAMYGTYIFSVVAKKHINFSIGSEFEYIEDYLTDKSLVIPISQSGESVDVIEPVTKAKEKGATIAAVTNALGSTLYRMADQKFLLNAGPEKSVVATKSLIAMVAVMLLTAYTLAQRQQEGKKLLEQAAKDAKNILSHRYAEIIKKLAHELLNKEHVYILGRGISYPTALEATLKLKEAAYIHAEGFAGGELKHGVMALIEKGTPCVVMAPNDQTYDDIISNAQEVKARGAYIIGVGPKNNAVFDVFLETADLSEATIISQVIIFQLLAYYTAVEKGLDPDKPRNLAKSVTVK